MRRKRKGRAFCAGALCAALLLGAPCTAHGDGPEVGARGAALVEAATGKLLYAKNAHERLPMASTTKIMTAIVALENSDPADMVEVTKAAYGTEGSSMYLALGEKVCMRDLLYGLMLASGNDAAVAIAVHVGGSVSGFADMMNGKANALGLANTHFVTPNGLHDPAHYTTAYELALIAAYAMQNPAFREIVGSQYYRTSTGNHVRTLKNKNKTLWNYDGGNGVKTGYTSAAGKCLAFAAEREGMQLVGVVLRTGNTYGDAFAMLDHGFAAFSMQTVVRAGDVIAHTRLTGGEKNSLALVAAEDIILPVDASSGSAFRTQVELDTICLPVREGDVCGRLAFAEEGRVLASTSLLSAEDIRPADVLFYFRRCLDAWGA